jgi:hypothetical protein
LRVALYAEGSAENRGLLPAPFLGETIPPTAHGPAHVLVARTLAQLRGRPREELAFVVPLRLVGREPRGSDLHVVKNLGKLLTYADRAARPDLGIVLIDEDGDSDRRRVLAAGMRDLQFLQPNVIGIAVREFEAWLIADSAARAAVLDITLTPPDLEAMKPGQAKELLQSWMAPRVSNLSQSERAAHIGHLRRQLAENVDLGRLASLRAFSRFQDDLRECLAKIA